MWHGWPRVTLQKCKDCRGSITTLSSTAGTGAGQSRAGIGVGFCHQRPEQHGQPYSVTCVAAEYIRANIVGPSGISCGSLSRLGGIFEDLC